MEERSFLQMVGTAGQEKINLAYHPEE